MGGGANLPLRPLFLLPFPNGSELVDAPFVTFPEHELATGWRFQTIFDVYQESNMAAGKPEML
jgi:hypothetical protein